MAKAPDKSAPDAAAKPLSVWAVRAFGQRPLRTFALVIALPAFLLYVSSAALVVLTLGYMANEIDRLDNAHGVSTMHAALDSFLDDLSSSVADEGTWNEAYLNVVVTPDPAWMDGTWGSTARIGQSYDNVLVTDEAGAIIFGENNDGAIKGNIGDRYPSAHAMLSELSQGIVATGDATTLSQFARDKDGTAGLAAISIHQSTPGQMSVPPETRRILWIARHLTPAVLQDFSSRYQIPLASLTDQDADDDRSSIDVVDADGQPAGTLSWVPDRPGDAAFGRAALVATAVMFVIGVILVVALGFVRRAILRRVAAMAAPAPKQEDAPAMAAALAHRVLGSVDENSLAGDSPIDGVNTADFSIQYQPIFDLRAESLIGVEALLRWVRPDRSVLTEEELTPADRARVLERVSIIAVRHATGEIAPLLGLMLTLSVTPAQLMNPVFAEKLAATLAATNFPPRRLQLAVDASLITDPEALREPVAGLRQSGIMVALDGFAINPATVASIDAKLADRARLAVNLIEPSVPGPAHMAYLVASIEAARAGGLAVTVPGIERKDQAALLLRLGCREFQGNLLARPMSIGGLTQLILAPAKPADVKKAG